MIPRLTQSRQERICDIHGCFSVIQKGGHCISMGGSRYRRGIRVCPTCIVETGVMIENIFGGELDYARIEKIKREYAEREVQCI